MMDFEVTEKNVDPLLNDALWSCSIDQWYKNSKLAAITFPTIFLPLSDQVVGELLHSKGLSVNDGCDANFAPWGDGSDDEWSRVPKECGISDEEQADCIESQRSQSRRVFESLEEGIRVALNKWARTGSDGGVFVKSHWSSAVDAHWIIPGGLLKCTTVDEVILAIRASDKIRDSVEMFKELVERRQVEFEKRKGSGIIEVVEDDMNRPKLALRKWHEIRKDMLFRCFVKRNKLIAISQKEVANYWSHLIEHRDENTKRIFDFWYWKMANNFALASYVFDVYLHSNGSNWLVDVSPYDERYTETILWTWEELDCLCSDRVEMRLVEQEYNIMPNLNRMVTGLPYDLLREESLTQLDMNSLIRKVKEIAKSHQDDDGSEGY